MLKSIRAAAFVLVLGLGTTGLAGDGIKVGRNGSVKIDMGSTRIETDAQTPDEGGSEGTAREENGRISLEGLGQKQTVTCEKGTEVLIEGTSNDYRIQGECKLVSVSGTGNKVRVESVGRLTVEGTGNRVTWQHGLEANKKPKIVTEGIDNRVTQGR